MVGFHTELCKVIDASVSSGAYRIDTAWGCEQMTITYEIVKQHILKWEFDTPPSINDYQMAMPGTIKALTSANISKLLIILNFVNEKNTPEAMGFTEFVFNDIKKYINKVAIVGSSAHQVRVTKVLEPLQSQGKEIAFFDSSEEAEDWLTR